MMHSRRLLLRPCQPFPLGSIGQNCLHHPLKTHLLSWYRVVLFMHRALSKHEVTKWPSGSSSTISTNLPCRDWIICCRICDGVGPPSCGCTNTKSIQHDDSTVQQRRCPIKSWGTSWESRFELWLSADCWTCDASWVWRLYRRKNTKHKNTKNISCKAQCPMLCQRHHLLVVAWSQTSPRWPGMIAPRVANPLQIYNRGLSSKSSGQTWSMNDAQICLRCRFATLDFKSRNLKAAEILHQGFAIVYDQPQLTPRNFAKNFMEDFIEALVVNRQCRWHHRQGLKSPSKITNDFFPEVGTSERIDKWHVLCRQSCTHATIRLFLSCFSLGALGRKLIEGFFWRYAHSPFDCFRHQGLHSLDKFIHLFLIKNDLCTPFSPTHGSAHELDLR